MAPVPPSPRCSGPPTGDVPGPGRHRCVPPVSPAGWTSATPRTAERREFDGQEDARQRLAHNFRSWLLAAADRYEEALHAINEGIAAAQRDRQNWALRVFQTSRGRQMLQIGQLGEAAVAVEGRYSRAEAH